tara:strand:+ start:333 stop:503 length:171 start_codon:yes stop_codon:yes gene_type:complete
MDECAHPGCGEEADGVDGKCMFHCHDDLAAAEELERQMWSDYCLNRVAPFSDEQDY